VVRFFSSAAAPEPHDLCLVHGSIRASGSHRSLAGPEFRRGTEGWWTPRSLLPETLFAQGPGEFLGEVERGGERISLWAVETSPPEGESWTPLRTLLGEGEPAQIKCAARAAELASWRAANQFCGACGTATVRRVDQIVFDCPSCGMEFWPRVTPAVIMLVHRGDEVLLVRHSRYSAPIFSCVAGFVETGETLEEAVAREVSEEVGITVGAPVYFASQAWPFPHALMTAFFVPWVAGDPKPDGREIVEAAWFRQDNLPSMPPPLSIARRLVRAHFQDNAL
jgi:NAD+ diphosphatase